MSPLCDLLLVLSFASTTPSCCIIIHDVQFEGIPCRTLTSWILWLACLYLTYQYDKLLLTHYLVPLVQAHGYLRFSLIILNLTHSYQHNLMMRASLIGHSTMVSTVDNASEATPTLVRLGSMYPFIIWYHSKLRLYYPQYIILKASLTRLSIIPPNRNKASVETLRFRLPGFTVVPSSLLLLEADMLLSTQ